MEIVIDYEGNERQNLFHENATKFKLYGGAVGGGKSVALCMEGLKLALTYPHSRGYLCRKTFQDLRKTTMQMFFDFVPAGIIRSYNKSDHLVTLINDSEVQFGDLENFNKIKSLNLAWYGIDEASEIDQEINRMMKSRLRQSSKKPLENWEKVVKGGRTFYIPRYFGLYASNPEPCWLKTDFVPEDDDVDLNAPYYAKPNHCFIRSLPSDNPYNPPNYEEDLMQDADVDWVNRYLKGSWSVFEGQIYKDFIRKRNVIRPFKIPDDWNRYRTIDLGTDDPTVCLWIAVDPKKNVYLYREYHESHRATEDHAEDICMASGAENYVGTIFDHHGLGKQLIIDYNRLGVKGTEHKEHRVIAGINRVQSLLKPQGEDGQPLLFVFDNCVHTIHEFEAYRWDRRKTDLDLNSKEKPLDRDNHSMDCIKNWAITFYYTKTPTESEIKEKRARRELRKVSKYKVSALTNY